MAEQNNLPIVQTPPPDGLNTDKTRKPEIIVSLTSYPARMPFVHIVLHAMLNQTVKPDRVILWLSEEQFPDCILPEWADMYKRAGVEFYFRPDDLKPHKKYYYVMKENPGAIIILADDDLYFENEAIEKLYNSYLKFPYAISALAAAKLAFDKHNRVLNSHKWAMILLRAEYIAKPSMRLYASSGHGTLYPPGCLHPEVFNTEIFKKLCLYDDELWLKIMSVLQGTPVVLADNNRFRTNIDGSQGADTLIARGGFDGFFVKDQIRSSTFAALNEFLGDGDTLNKRMLTMFQSENDRFFTDFYIKKGIHKKAVYTAVTDRDIRLEPQALQRLAGITYALPTPRS